MQTDLSKFTTGTYQVGASKIKVLTWYFVNYYIFDSSFPWPYIIKVKLLRLFGAKIGVGLVVKPKIRIKNAWRLVIGDNCWIGESVWIDNLENVTIGNNVSISQGAMLLTGNHDYTVTDFRYRLGEIQLEDGVWIGAKAVVCPGIICKSHSILTVNSVANKQLNEFGIYSGNPAVFVRIRKFTMAE
ncbi:MAG: WcaF family extracellular polysaccharide biosynthesis acetyltransferase [Mucilaginibacter sp.]|uniref:WcaF family extracellular polysaccharide biosynthesis acetyltransferase n=1 Tax=Mucilaginibacter sp. TaxID=1882438 RepID=UPI003263B3F3